MNLDALPKEHKLLWFIINSVIGRGGFGITYEGYDTHLNNIVAIKEFFPTGMATRSPNSFLHVSVENHDVYQSGMHRFLEEARTLAKFSHPNIVTVHNVFEENQTAYIIMEHIKGKRLDHWLPQDGALPSEASILNVLFPLMDGLKLIHSAGFIHRDIKPANIMVRDNGTPVLIDFGSARQAMKFQTHTITAIVTKGYAPFEQYGIEKNKDEQGPCSDIYSLGATLYKIISGNLPIDALSRARAHLNGRKDPLVPAKGLGAGQYSSNFLSAIDWALGFRSQTRPQSIGEWEKRFGRINSGVKFAAKQSPRNLFRSWRMFNYFSAKNLTTKLGFSMLSLVGILAIAYIFFEQQRTITPDNKPIVSSVSGKGFDKNLDLEKENPRNLIKSKASSKNQKEIDRLLAAADETLTKSRLTKPSGNNAAELLKTVLELDPDNLKAKNGLKDIANWLIWLSKKDISDGQFKQAEANLRIAEEIFPNAQDLIPTRDKLAKLVADTNKQKKVEQLLAEGNINIEAKRLSLPSGNNALENFNSVRELDPDNEKAIEGIEEIVVRYVMFAEKAISKGKLNSADTFLRRADNILPGTKIIQQTKQRLDQKQVERLAAVKKQKIKLLLAKAEENFKASRLTEPTGNNASANFVAILEIDPNNVDAKRGFERVKNYQTRPKSDNTQKQLNRTKPSLIQDQREIQRLLSLAKADVKALRLSEPTESNAVSRYKAVLKLEANNREAKQGLEEIINRYVDLANASIYRQQFKTAEKYLLKAIDILPESRTAQDAYRYLNQKIQEFKSKVGKKRDRVTLPPP